MAFKIALFAALCVAQVLAFRPSDEAFLNDALSGSFDVQSRGIVDDVIRCTDAQRKNFDMFARRVTAAYEESMSWIEPELKAQMKDKIEGLTDAVNSISSVLREFPKRISNKMQVNELKAALSEILYTRDYIRFNRGLIRKFKGEMVQEVPELEESLEDMMAWIDRQFSRGQKMITDSFIKCIYVKGPKTLA